MYVMVLAGAISNWQTLMSPDYSQEQPTGNGHTEKKEKKSIRSEEDITETRLLMENNLEMSEFFPKA